MKKQTPKPASNRIRNTARMICGAAALSCSSFLFGAYFASSAILQEGEAYGNPLIDIGTRVRFAGARDLAYDVSITPGELRRAEHRNEPIEAPPLPPGWGESRAPRPMPPTRRPQPKR